MKNAAVIGSLSGKIAASVVVLACVAVGVVGLVLPIIPGLLFLAIAAFVVARHFPSADALLRRHRAIGKHLNRADDFRRLSLVGKMQIAGLVCVKMLLRGVSIVASLLAKLGGGSR